MALTAKRNLKMILVPIITFIIGINFCFGASAIQKLTSKNKAKTVTQDSTSAKAFQIPGSLQKHSIGFGLGQTFIRGQLKNDGENKITWDLLYNYSASYSFDLLANFHHSKHKFKNRYVQLTGLTMGIKGKFYHFDAFSPFAIGGLGFYSPRVKRSVEGQVMKSESEIVFGNHFGMGVDLKLNDKFTVGIIGQYHNPFDIQQELGPEVEGSYFKLLITTLYTF